MKTLKRILPIALTMALGFWAGDLMARHVQDDLAAGLGVERAIDGLADALRTPLAVGWDRTSVLCGAAGAAAVGLIWLVQWGKSLDNWREREEYGSARWARRDEMDPYTDHDPRQNIQMTLTEGLSIDAKATRRNLNTLVIGSSGSGKTATHVIPNILKANMNFACTDPKGELYDTTHEALEKAGYTVHKLDLVDLTCATHFNPLAYIDPDKPDVAIMRLVTNIMDNTNGSQKENSGDGFWDKAERSLLTALTALVYYMDPAVMEDLLGVAGGRTLNAVADLAGKMEASEEDETKASPVDVLVDTCMEMYEEAKAMHDEMEAAGTLDGEMERTWRIANGLRFAATQYRPFTQGAGETKKSIIISLGVRLAPIQVGAVRDILSTDDIGIDDIGGYLDEDGGCRSPRRRMAIFLALPDEDPTFNFLAAICYQCLFDSIIQRCRAYPGQRLATPLHCFLDEFANIGRIPNFDKLIATIRSRGVSVSIILQTIAQLKTMYRDSWETVAGNCDSTLFLGGAEQSTTEWVSKLLGKETIDLRTTSVSKGTTGSYTVNRQRTGRELLTPDELAQLDNDRCIYVLRGLHPFLSRKAWPGTTIAKPRSTLRHSRGWTPAA